MLSRFESSGFVAQDSTSSRMPSRASASSSTIEINGALDISIPEETSRNQDCHGTTARIGEI